MQKKLSSNKFWFGAWCIYHGALVLAFCVSLVFSKGINFDADFTKMMPVTADSKAARIADKAVSQGSGSSVFIIAGHEDFATAREAAVLAYESLLKEKTKFKTLSLYTSDETASDVQQFLADWRFHLLNKETSELIMAPGGAETFARNALAELYGGFSMTSLDSLIDDPFMLDSSNLKNYLDAIRDSGTALGPKDGVLAAEKDGRWYVMIRGELSEEGVRLASKKNAVPLIYKRCGDLETKFNGQPVSEREDVEIKGLRFVYYGTVFHSYKSSNSASLEISIISTVSLIAVVVILLLVFRSGLPLFGSIFSITVSVLGAFCATHLVFGQMHMTALVFGTSLIGSCIDYSLHYFINWKASVELDSSEKIRHHIFNGLVLSLLSTEICFFLLVFAPFGLLKQMAVFSFAGILSSFLTAGGFFTLFKLPPAEKRTIPVLNRLNFKIPHRNLLCWVVIALIFVTSGSVLLANRNKVRIQNDIKNLYKMSGRLKVDTAIAYKVLSYSPTSWLIVSGDSVEEVLQTEEKLIPQIKDSFVCTSKFIPSVQAQTRSLDAVNRLVSLGAMQYENLGFDRSMADDFKKSVSENSKKFLTPESPLPESLKTLLNILWIGNVEGKYYSIILPATTTDEDLYKNLAASYENVYYENKMAGINQGLNRLTSLILFMFGIAFVLIAVIMKFFYNWKDTLKILSIPVLSVMVIAATFILSGQKIEFFGITGVILVFGLGLDYVIYRIENKENKAESFAIALSFLTTAISFGALALSSFVPVHVIGLSIFSGLVTAFICAIL